MSPLQKAVKSRKQHLTDLPHYKIKKKKWNKNKDKMREATEKNTLTRNDLFICSITNLHPSLIIFFLFFLTCFIFYSIHRLIMHLVFVYGRFDCSNYCFRSVEAREKKKQNTFPGSGKVPIKQQQQQKDKISTFG